MNNQMSTLQTEYGIFSYELLDLKEPQSISITGYEGKRSMLEIPASFNIDSKIFPVVAISDKAFFSNATIEKIILPASIEKIGNWAFSHMPKLTTISIPAKNITLGKQVFLDSPLFSSVKIQDNKEEALDYYLMACLSILKNPLLFTPENAGTNAWFSKWDTSVESYLNRPEDADFEPVFLGWFNDEDEMDTQYPRYLKKVRENKAALSLKRLRYPYHLSEEKKEAYLSYIKKFFNKGIWELVCTSDYANDLFYINLLLEEGLICDDNIDQCISDLVDSNASEATVLLLNHKNKLQKKDFFAALGTL